MNKSTRHNNKTPDFLSEADVAKLFKACKSAEERFLIAVLFDTGARATEFHNIRFEDIHIPDGNANFVKVTLKEEYSKTKGRTISLYWKHSLEAVSDYVRERRVQRVRSVDPVFKKTYMAARLFLHRLGKKILGRSIHYHLFRHSSATHYASKMNRQQLCIRYGWTFSSDMPDIYISRAGVDSKELDESFSGTEIRNLQQKLQKTREDEGLKESRIEELEEQLAEIQQTIKRLLLLVDKEAVQERRGSARSAPSSQASI